MKYNISILAVVAIIFVSSTSFTSAQQAADISKLVAENKNFAQLNGALATQNPQLIQNVQSTCGGDNKARTQAQNDACNQMETQALAISNDPSLSQQDKITKLQAVYQGIAPTAANSCNLTSGANSSDPSATGSDGKPNSAAASILSGFGAATLIALVFFAIGF